MILRTGSIFDIEMMHKTYKTSDLYEASLFYANDSGTFLGIEKGRGREFLFVFDVSENSDLRRKYYSKLADIDAKTYADAVKTLKDVVFSKLREEGM